MGIATDLVKATTRILYVNPACAADVTTPTMIDVSDFEGWGFVTLTAKSVSGTTPTADVKLQESEGASGTRSDVTSGALTQVSGASAVIYTIPVNFDACKSHLGAYVDLGGTDPVIGLSVTVTGQKKYN